MEMCMNCQKELPPLSKFCPYCGKKVENQCAVCRMKVSEDYKYCPNCGSGVGYTAKPGRIVIEAEGITTSVSTTFSTSRSTTSGSDQAMTAVPNMDEIKKKIQKLREERLKTKSSSSQLDTGRHVGNRQIKPKSDLKFHVGLKMKKRNGEYTLVNKQAGGGILKLLLKRQMNFRDVTECLSSKFSVDTYKNITHLLDNRNQVIDENEFSVAKYALEYPYVGALRLYLAVEPKIEDNDSDPECTPPPILTPQKPECPPVSLDQEKMKQNPTKPCTGTTSTVGVDQEKMEESPTKPCTGTTSTVGVDQEKMEESPIKACTGTTSTLGVGVDQEKMEESPINPCTGTTSTVGVGIDQVKMEESPTKPCTGTTSTVDVGVDQVKMEEGYQKITVSMDEVKQYFMQEIIEDTRNKSSKEHMGDLKESRPNITPLHTRNAIVKYFLELEEKNGKTFERSHTGWGDFVLLPDLDFNQFLKFREQGELSGLAYLCPPLCYFLGMYDNDLNISLVTDDIVTLESHVKEEYISWCNDMKAELQ